ncbi:MAG: hypothetical protein ACRD7E_19925, partial [Bryobacteraceae bacterium]
TAENVPSLQGGRNRHETSEFMQSNWTPAMRFAAGAVGGGLAIYGLSCSGVTGKATAALGLGLLARGLTNTEVSEWANAGPVREVVGIER